MPHLAGHFEQLDMDKDGQISADEMHGFRMAGPKAERKDLRMRFEAADTNADGALALAEAQAGMPWLAERFSAVDADNDGRITRGECRDAHKRPSSEQL
jgi:Ca2+-binding EF-hand superfamily protein